MEVPIVGITNRENISGRQEEPKDVKEESGKALLMVKEKSLESTLEEKALNIRTLKGIFQKDVSWFRYLHCEVYERGSLSLATTLTFAS